MSAATALTWHQHPPAEPTPLPTKPDLTSTYSAREEAQPRWRPGRTLPFRPAPGREALGSCSSTEPLPRSKPSAEPPPRQRSPRSAGGSVNEPGEWSSGGGRRRGEGVSAIFTQTSPFTFMKWGSGAGAGKGLRGTFLPGKALSRQAQHAASSGEALESQGGSCHRTPAETAHSWGWALSPPPLPSATPLHGGGGWGRQDL